MKVLIACEESQTVCKAFRALGYEAYSCDVQEPSGGHPEWHILGDALPLLNGDAEFTTMDGRAHRVSGKWDMIIAFPHALRPQTQGQDTCGGVGGLISHGIMMGFAARLCF